MSCLNLKEAQISGLRQSQVQTELLPLCLKTVRKIFPCLLQVLVWPAELAEAAHLLHFIMLFFHVSIFFLLVGIAVIKLGLLNLT